MRHKKQTDMQNNWHLQAFCITAHYWELELWIWVRMVHAKRQCIWSKNPDQPSFNLKLLKDNRTLKHINNYVHDQHLCSISIFWSCLEWNWNTVFSFKNVQTKKKGYSVLFKKIFFVMLVAALIFRIKPSTKYI